jgi:hypothetical protein
VVAGASANANAVGVTTDATTTVVTRHDQRETDENESTVHIDQDPDYVINNSRPATPETAITNDGIHDQSLNNNIPEPCNNIDSNNNEMVNNSNNTAAVYPSLPNPQDPVEVSNGVQWFLDNWLV